MTVSIKGVNYGKIAWKLVEQGKIITQSAEPTENKYSAIFAEITADRAKALGKLLLLEFRRENLAEARLLIQAGADVNFQDERGMTSLHYCASTGQRSSVRMLVATGKCDYLLRDNQGNYACLLAAIWTEDRALEHYLWLLQHKQATERGVPAWEPPLKCSTPPPPATWLQVHSR